MKEGTADSQLPRNTNHRDITARFREPTEDPKERAKEHRTNFSADPDFQNCIRIRIYRLAGEEAAGSSHCFDSDAKKHA